MYQWTSVGYTTFTRPLELAFSNGYGPQGERIGPQTGELTEMTSYNDFEAAVKQQLAAITAKAAQATLIIQKLHRQYAPKPLISCLIEGCGKRSRCYRGRSVVKQRPRAYLDRSG
jgi:formate C-acetyltransferase